VDTTHKRGQDVIEPRRADEPDPGAKMRLRGREERWLDLDRAARIRSARVSSALSDLGQTTEIQRQGGGHGRGGAARSRGGNSPETSRPTTAGHQRLVGWPRRAQGNLADSAEGTTPTREHQKALHTARRAIGGAGQLRRAIAR
jgi:hypothetical protein